MVLQSHVKIITDCRVPFSLFQNLLISSPRDKCLRFCIISSNNIRGLHINKRYISSSQWSACDPPRPVMGKGSHMWANHSPVAASCFVHDDELPVSGSPLHIASSCKITGRCLCMDIHSVG